MLLLLQFWGIRRQANARRRRWRGSFRDDRGFRRMVRRLTAESGGKSGLGRRRSGDLNGGDDDAGQFGLHSRVGAARGLDELGDFHLRLAVDAGDFELERDSGGNVGRARNL